MVNYAEYNARDQLDSLYRGSMGSGQELNSFYGYRDVDGLPSYSWTNSGGNTPLDQFFSYSFSNAGRAEWIYEEEPTGNNKACYQYDTNNHLTRAWTLTGSLACTASTNTDNVGPEPYQVAYTYDPIGRITSASGTGTVNGTYTYNTGTTKPAHAPLTAGTRTYTYDNAGNRLTGGPTGAVTTYTYDTLNRLATTTGHVTSGMLYDTGGQRVKRTVGATSTYYLTSGLELTADGNPTISISLAGKPVATYTPDKNLWFQNADHLGTASYTKTSTGTQEKYRRFTPYGEPRSATSDPAGGTPSDLGFTNQRDDGALNLTYYGARYYDPQTAQFTQPDPLIANPLNSQDRNRYAYVRNNPLIHTDPTGNLICENRHNCSSPTVTRRPAATKTASSTSSTLKKKLAGAGAEITKATTSTVENISDFLDGFASSCGILCPTLSGGTADPGASFGAGQVAGGVLQIAVGLTILEAAGALTGDCGVAAVVSGGTIAAACTVPALIAASSVVLIANGIKQTADGISNITEGGSAGIDRGDGRDIYGRFTGRGGYGSGAEAQGLANYTTATGREAISTRVRATLPDGSIRYYDGLSLGPDGKYQGVEVKSGSASRTPSQRAFDDQVDAGQNATAVLNGTEISISSTYLIRVP